MIYTFHADATIRNKSGNVLAQVRTKKGKAWTPKDKDDPKICSSTPFRDEADAFSILVQHKKKKRKHRIYELDQKGKLIGLSNWFKINTSREKWINDNSYTQTKRPIKLKIIEATPNQAHGYFTFLFSEGVTGFSKDDITVTGGSKGSFYYISDDGSEYGMYAERNYSQSEGILTIAVADEAAHSADGKTNQSAKYTADFDYKPLF